MLDSTLPTDQTGATGGGGLVRASERFVRPKEVFAIDSVLDPWDALEILERHAHQPGFAVRWRAFLRACSVLLLPDLPAEASEWVAAADEFDQGRLTPDQLTEARVRAWQVYDAQRDSSPASVLSGLRAVMHRLWPELDAKQWYEAARHFLDSCDAAGLEVEEWWPLLREQFADILEGRPT